MNQQRPTLSAAIIAKNEERHLRDCLESVKGWVDDIVILDSGSNDATKTIAAEFTDRVFEHTAWAGFGKQRQIAQSYVKTDYVLWLDADERVTGELMQSILAALRVTGGQAVYRVNRLSYVFGRFIRHSGWYPDKVIRLYRTEQTGFNDNLVHEKVLVEDTWPVIDLDGDLLHYTYNDLNHYLVKSTAYAKAWADQKQHMTHKVTLKKAMIHALFCFVKMYLMKRGFLDGKQGLLLALLSAHSTFIKYAELWVRHRINQ